MKKKVLQLSASIYSEVEKKMLTVKLVLDKNLRPFKYGKNDFRLSNRKKEAIDYVSKAFTIGDVLSGPESDQINYRKLALLPQPDTNAYPGAKECSKKLQHAYNAIKEGLPKSTAALQIENPKHKFTGAPPNVISVITNKRKLCTVTVFSEAVLDIRASIVLYEKNVKEELHAYISDILNENLEAQDFEDEIHTSDGKSGIFIDCIKQITAHHIWVKEIGTFLFEVSVKEMRGKFSHQKDWKESIEVYMKLIMDGRDWKKTTAKDLTEEFLKVKEEWNNICPQF